MIYHLSIKGFDCVFSTTADNKAHAKSLLWERARLSGIAVHYHDFINFWVHDVGPADRDPPILPWSPPTMPLLRSDRATTLATLKGQQWAVPALSGRYYRWPWEDMAQEDYLVFDASDMADYHRGISAAQAWGKRNHANFHGGLFQDGGAIIWRGTPRL